MNSVVNRSSSLGRSILCLLFFGLLADATSFSTLPAYAGTQKDQKSRGAVRGKLQQPGGAPGAPQFLLQGSKPVSTLGVAEKGKLIASKSAPLSSSSVTDGAGTDGADVVDMVVASIDGEPLTTSDLRRFISAQGQKPPADLNQASVENKRTLRDFVTSRLLEKEAEKSGISVSDEEVANYIQEIKKQNGVDDAGLERLLRTRGLTPEQYRKQVASDVLRTRLVGTKIRPKVSITDEEVKRYIADNKVAVPSSGEIHLHQIFLPLTESSTREGLKSQLQSYREQIAAGKKMEDLAKESYTDLGFLKPADLRPEFQSALAILKMNEVSGVVGTEKGYYLFQISEKTEGGELSKAVMDRIRQEIFQVKFKQELEKYFTEELTKKYDVEFKL